MIYENQSRRRKPVPVLIHLPQITQGMTWDRAHDYTMKLVGEWPNHGGNTQHERNEHKIVVQNLIKNVVDNF
jgi:hypothetical protein